MSTYFRSLPKELRNELNQYNDFNNYADYMELREMGIIPYSRHIILRRHIPYYKYYFWPSILVQRIPFFVSSTMTNDHFRSEVCRGFNQEDSRNITVYEYKVCPKNRPDIRYAHEYMTEIIDVSQYRDNEEYLVEFH